MCCCRRRRPQLSPKWSCPPRVWLLSHRDASLLFSPYTSMCQTDLSLVYLPGTQAHRVLCVVVLASDFEHKLLKKSASPEQRERKVKPWHHNAHVCFLLLLLLFLSRCAYRRSLVHFVHRERGGGLYLSLWQRGFRQIFILAFS